MGTMKNKVWRVALAGLGTNLAAGIFGTLTEESLDEAAQNRSVWEKVKEKIVFARAQSVDIDLGARYL